MLETMSYAALRNIALVVDACNACALSLPENFDMTFDEFVCHCAEAIANLEVCPSENLVSYVVGCELDLFTPKASATEPKKYVVHGINETTGEVEYAGRHTDDMRIISRECNVCVHKGLRIKICECDDN